MRNKGDSITVWMDYAGRYPLLPKSEVIRLGRIIQDLETSDAKRDRAVQKLVIHNLRLIPRIVRNILLPKRSFHYGDHMTEDLFQNAVIGLERAARKFDPYSGYAFSTYAFHWIYQSVTRYLYDNISNIRVPESTLREYYKLAKNFKSQDFPDYTPQQVERFMDAHRALNCRSLDGKIMQSNSDEVELAGIVSSCQDEPEARDNYEVLMSLADLTEQQTRLFNLIFIESCNWTEAGRKLGINRDRVRTLYYDGIKKLRSKVTR